MVRVKKWSMLIEWEDNTYDILDQSNIKTKKRKIDITDGLTLVMYNLMRIL